MPPDYESWDGLVTAVEGSIKDILLVDVAPVAEDILKKHIESDIYGAYAPKNGGWFAGRHYESAYSRRHVLESSLKSTMENATSMLVTSSAPANQSLVPGYSFSNRYDGGFLQMLENGDMGIWRKGFPRPAVSNAQKEIDSSAKIRAAIKNGIKRVIKG